MTRRSRRDIERAVDDLGGDDAAGGLNVDILYPGDDADPDPDADMVLEYVVVMDRRDAERAGHEILGPVEGVSGDVVRIAGHG